MQQTQPSPQPSPQSSPQSSHQPSRQTGPSPQTRPRVEGERETEVLDAAARLLVRVGYDRLTMDAVAAEARASKATLYRRWSTKTSLVVDAVLRSKGGPPLPSADTGSLRGDLVELATCRGGLTDPHSSAVMAAVVTALHHDPAFAEEFRDRVLAPRIKAARVVFERARARGEITAEVDLDLLTPALAGIVLHRSFVEGRPPDRATVTRVVDEIILPAATRPPSPHPHPHPSEDSR